MNLHARKLTIVESPEKGTEETELSLLDRLRDALGGYTAHSRLEVRKTGRQILDATARIHLAIRRAFSAGGRTATDWSDDSGFRSAGDYRKAACGEHPYNETDIATLRVLDVDAYRALVDDLARDAGGRFELVRGDGGPMTQALARLGTCTAQLNSTFLMALAPEGDGGSAITAAEAEVFRAHLVALQRQVAEAEAALAALEVKR